MTNSGNHDAGIRNIALGLVGNNSVYVRNDGVCLHDTATNVRNSYVCVRPKFSLGVNGQC